MSWMCCLPHEILLKKCNEKQKPPLEGSQIFINEIKSGVLLRKPILMAKKERKAATSRGAVDIGRTAGTMQISLKPLTFYFRLPYSTSPTTVT